MQHGTQSAQLYRKTLFKYCATWFFKGPATKIEDMANFSAFIAERDTIFRKSGQVFKSFDEEATVL